MVAIFIVVAVLVVIGQVWPAPPSTTPEPTLAPKSALAPAPVPKNISALAPATTPAPVPAPPVTFTLNTTINPSMGGSVSPGGGTYNNDTQVTLNAVPSQGYQFDHWSGDASGTSSTVTISMNSNKGIIANFSKIQ